MSTLEEYNNQDIYKKKGNIPILLIYMNNKVADILEINLEEVHVLPW